MKDLQCVKLFHFFFSSPNHRFCSLMLTLVSWITSSTASSEKPTEGNLFSGKRRKYTKLSVQRKMKRCCSQNISTQKSAEESPSVYQKKGQAKKNSHFYKKKEKKTIKERRKMKISFNQDDHDFHFVIRLNIVYLFITKRFFAVIKSHCIADILK